LLDVRKEITFCHRTKIPVLGVVQNMSGFSCTSCGVKSRLFAPTVDSVGKVAAELHVPILGEVPLDPDLMASCDIGEAYHINHPTSPSVPYLCNLVKRLLATTPQLDQTDKRLQLSAALDELIQLYEQSKPVANADSHSHTMGE
jgi:hypothetical protein